MTTEYCTHYACRIAHARKEGSNRAAKQRDRHGGKAPCTLAEIHAAREAFSACLATSEDEARPELKRLFGKCARD